MPRETVTLALNSGSDVSLSDFAKAVSCFDRLIKALSEAKAGRSEPVQWQMEELAVGSAVVTARATHSDPARVEAVTQAFEAVGHALGQGDPAPFGERVQAPARDMLALLSNGVREIRFETSEAEAVLRSGQDRRPVVVPLDASIGAVEGVVEVLSRRRGLHFNLYDPLLQRPVSCYVSGEHSDLMRDIWGKRVVVRGRVSREPERGYPVAVREITAIDPVGDRAAGSYRKARGIIPLEAGAPRPEETIRKMRDAT